MGYLKLEGGLGCLTDFWLRSDVNRGKVLGWMLDDIEYIIC